MNYWLMKSEPGEFSIDDLAAAPGGETFWDGVRNYQARNFMRDQMKVGDGVLYYHSNCPETGVVGIASVCREAYPDHTAFRPRRPPLRPEKRSGQPALVHGGHPLRAQVQAGHPAARTAPTRGWAAPGHAPAAARQPALDHAVSDEEWNFILSLE